MPRLRALAVPVLGALLVLGTAGCGSDDAPDASRRLSATEHGKADVAFAGDMIQHHAQALAMVDLTLGRPLEPEVAALAEEIRAAQGPEIETLVDWLTEWGEEVPETMRDHSRAGHGPGAMSDAMEGLDHGDLPGMMSAEEMDALQDAPDAGFQELWLRMMVEHHEGAVELAEEQQEEGRYQPAVELADAIVAGQTDELETMRALLP